MRIFLIVMKQFVFICIISLQVLLYANPISEMKKSVSITHINDFNIAGKISSGKTGDDLLTGVLKIEYKKEKSYLDIILNSYTQRHIVDGKRVDTLTIAYLKNIFSKSVEQYSYYIFVGGQYISSGNYGGEFLQDLIHRVTHNMKYNLSYSSQKHQTIGIVGKYIGYYTYDINTVFYNTLNLAFNIDKSIDSEFKIGVATQINHIGVWFGVGMKYINPFNHSVVRFSTIDKCTYYALSGISFDINEQYSINIETALGGGYLGRQHGYTTKFSVQYFFDN